MTVPAEQAEIAFFGGSFTAVPRPYMLELLEAACPFVQSGRFAGIRLSTRPDAVDDEVLAVLKRYGVTTVELGAQSMDDRVLKRCGRGHTAEQVAEAARCIKRAGLRLGLQMMTGLPGDTDAGALETARQLAELHPDCVRIYPTVVLEHTPLAEWYRKGQYSPQTEEQAVALCARLLTFFEERRIPVIRLGLHAEPALTEHRLAGPFHPAFRERVESRRYRQRVQELLGNTKARAVVVTVHPTRISQVTGQKKENIRAWQAQGYTVRVASDAALPREDIRVEVIE